MTCTLCLTPDAIPLTEAHGRRYLRCAACRLTFVHPADRPDADAERAHYGTHENDPHDPGYRRFLSRLADPLTERLRPGAEGLDYGSGPGPTLPLMLRERGFTVAVYDPFFAPDSRAFTRTYDFVTATEVVEHFFAPRPEFDRLAGLLRPGAWLGVMTELVRDDRPLEAWRYARDPTHVSLYHAHTLRWIADHYGWHLHQPEPRVALFHVPGTAHESAAVQAG